MKKTSLLLFLIVLVSGITKAQADLSANKDELVITEKGKIQEATVICLDAIEAPTKYNEFVQPIINLKDFPKKDVHKTSDELRQAIEKWLANNPKQIDIIRKERKIAHDKLYGKRPY